MPVRPPSGEPVVSLEELLARVENDLGLLRDMILAFQDGVPSQMTALRQAIAQGDLKTTERASHTLKGMFLSLVAGRAAAAAAELEQWAYAGDTAALPGALALLEDEVALLLPYLESQLPKIES